jgi:hypothetical protein
LNGINLTPGSGPVWKKAFENQLSEQVIFNNAANVFSSLFIRIMGWLVLDMVLYQSGNLFGSSEKNNEV